MMAHEFEFDVVAYVKAMGEVAKMYGKDIFHEDIEFEGVNVDGEHVFNVKNGKHGIIKVFI